MSENFSAHCYLMPVYDTDTDSSIRVSENKIQVTDQSKTARMEFNYDNVFSSQHDFIKSSFSKVVAPLIKQTIEGESTMVVFGGLQSLKMNEFLLSHTVMQGLISQAAGHLLNSVNDGEHKVGSVTFSWFKVDCAGQENLTDVLKTASTSNAASGPSSKSDSLVLRELGKGRGMVVPGLWEVEIAGGGDIEAVINHLQKIVPDAADHSAGNAHTVMQLTVTNQQKAAKAKPVVQQREHSALGTVTDGPGVGRISFVLLSNMSPTATTKAPRNGTPATPKSGFYPWVEHARVVMQWLESRRASTPFHKSRLLLLLKDVLLRRQKAAMLLMLQPSVEQHSANMEWLRLVSQLTTDHTAISNSLNDPTLNNGTKTPRSATPTPLSRTTSAAPADLRAGTASPSFGSPAPRSATPQPASRPANPSTAAGMASLGSFTPGAGGPTGNGINSSQTNPAAAVGGGSLNGRRGSQSQMNASNANLKVGVSSPALTERKSSFLRAGGGYAGVHEFGPEDLIDGQFTSETEKALQVALEASQSESAALKLAYQYSSEKYAELKSTYEDLLEQLKEEGAFLVKRDRERFRAALKDLKDYEIYKEVMEAAMVRMQQELEAYADENATLKSGREKEDKAIKKHREFNDKYSKDLVATKKKLADAQSRIATLEKQVKQVTKEREAAVVALAHFKSNGAQHEGQTRMQEQLRQQENEDLQRRLRKMEDRCRALETDKEAILASNAAEASSLRAAHTKALEMLMNYQEENDKLRVTAHAESKSSDRKPPVSTPYPSSSHSHHHAGNKNTTSTSHANAAQPQPPLPPLEEPSSPLPPLPPSEEDSVLSME